MTTLSEWGMGSCRPPPSISGARLLGGGSVTAWVEARLAVAGTSPAFVEVVREVYGPARTAASASSHGRRGGVADSQPSFERRGPAMNALQQLRQCLDGLGRRSTPHYGQLLLLVVLGLALWIGQHRISEVDRAVREAARAGGQRSGEAATVLSFLPEPLLRDEHLIQLCAGIFALASLLWLAQVLLPWSSWVSAIAFIALLSLYWENTVRLSHHMHVVSMVLIILALWYGLYAQEIRTALAAGRFWTTPLCPGWVHALCVFYLGLVYGLAGLAKLYYSGFAWVNGVLLSSGYSCAAGITR
jgi:fumarate reductase subunit D